MYSVILCGGAGTRLWPLSRKNFAKHFLALYSDKSLLQETYLRMRGIMPKEKIFFSTGKDDLFNVFNQIKEVEKNYDKEQIIMEPVARNTAPAIALSVKFLTEKVGIDPKEPILFLPADHYIKDVEKFQKIIKNALQNVGDHIGTIGITPTKPVTGYGYIQKGKRIGSYFEVVSYKEKPDEETAKKYLNEGAYVWNSGLYLFSPETFNKELREHAPDIYAYFSKPYEEFFKDFEKVPSIAIDYALSEKSKNVVVFEGDFGWNDIGSFDSLAEIDSVKINGKHLSIDSKNIFVHTENSRLIATLGVEDLNIIETTDSILIHKRGRAEEVKRIVESLKKNNAPELEHNLVVHRPWGKYEILIGGPSHQVKRLTVYPGAKLSLQSHNHRAEHWVVVKGTAKVVNGENFLTLHENESTYISAKSKHQLSNPGKENLEIIEVQTGDYLKEDDIVRYKDEYGRLSGVAAA